MEYDLLNLPYEVEARRHKLKRTVQAPNSYFLRIRTPQGNVLTTFSNSQTVLTCPETQSVVATPTGGKLKISEGCDVMVLGKGKKNKK